MVVNNEEGRVKSDGARGEGRKVLLRFATNDSVALLCFASLAITVLLRFVSLGMRVLLHFAHHDSYQ